MAGTVTLSKKMLGRRFEGATDPKAQAKRRAPDHPYNIALVCDNMVQIFTPDRFADIPREVERLLGWGHALPDIDLQLIESDDPFG